MGSGVVFYLILPPGGPGRKSPEGHKSGAEQGFFLVEMDKGRQKPLTTGSACATMQDNFKHRETVDAEITAVMPAQRAWVAENQVRHRPSNGPLRAQSTVTCRGYAGIPQRAREVPVNQGGTADRRSVLDRAGSVRDVFVFPLGRRLRGIIFFRTEA